MSQHDMPYEFGDVTTDGGLGDDDLPAGHENGSDIVIVDGEVRSFRSYVAADTD